MHATTQLPYMGKPEEAHKKLTHSQALEIPFSGLRDFEQRKVDERLNEQNDPLAVLIAKVTNLAELLGCTEAEAEKLLFKRI